MTDAAKAPGSGGSGNDVGDWRARCRECGRFRRCEGAGQGATASRDVIERGRYLVTVGNCNDCHTANFPPRDGKVPESEWLLGGGPLGLRGPWGTTYASNLRLTASRVTEVEWVKC